MSTVYFNIVLLLIYEYEQDNKSILAKGRLKQNVKFWKYIGSSDFVIDVIKNGYKIPFFSLPPSSEFKNNKSAKKQSSFVSEAIQDLLDKGLILECKVRPHIVNWRGHKTSPTVVDLKGRRCQKLQSKSALSCEIFQIHSLFRNGFIKNPKSKFNRNRK